MRNSGIRQSIKLFCKLALQKLVGERHLVYRMPMANPCVALTFDDGPHPEFTPLVLDILRKADVKATFFLVGKQVERYPDLARKLLADGHALGMHTYSHCKRDRVTFKQKKEDLAKTQAAFKMVFGSASNIFRPPHGRLSLAELIFCMKRFIRTVMWDADPEDYRKKSEDVLRTRIGNMKLVNGSIILLHDDHQVTISILPELIRKVRRDGFSFGVIT
jgi:peptidoglycan/xylan/chitin deacetylase (PgdA/CDA1 family)